MCTAPLLALGSVLIAFLIFVFIKWNHDKQSSSVGARRFEYAAPAARMGAPRAPPARVPSPVPHTRKVANVLDELHYQPHNGKHAVEIADQGTLDRILKGGDAVAMVYSDSCPHCTTMKPKFMEAARYAQLPFILVNSVRFPMVVQRFSVKGVPTVMRLKNGQIVSVYEGDRGVDSLVKFAFGGGTA
eukprot:gnl/Hemi2/22426_TR7471_c0_g1_i1.p1 gnl/Hemi2/22426_TR7471_c0_g1~~gnl/Hemi2/22426_TR7471_c0_g1_i1.p1  ORF type:complete len:187 (+),score=32.69 gnl/Hemi2/22426_TR7471_c0_g1_i1:810-1370(+)